MGKRLLIMVLAFCMVLTLLPTPGFAAEDGIPIGYLNITTANAGNIQNQFDDIEAGIVEVTSDNGIITIKLLKDIIGRIKFNASGYYIFDAVGHTISGGEKEEAILIDHNVKGVTLELVGKGIYETGRNHTIYLSGGFSTYPVSMPVNKLIIRSGLFKGNISINLQGILEFALEDGYDYFTVKNDDLDLYEAKNTSPKTRSYDIYGQGTGLVVAQHIDNYAIDLDTRGTYTFPPAIKGYGEQNAKTVTITNTGRKETGPVSIGISDGSAFVLFTDNISNITTGSALTFTVQPKTGLAEGTYTDTVTVSGSGIRAQSFNIVFAVFPEPPLVTHVITATAITGGSISPSGSVTVINGESKTFTITPNRNYSIADVKVDGISQGPISTYTFINVTGDHNISATFKYKGGGKKVPSKNDSSTNDNDYLDETPKFVDIENHWAKEDIEFVVSQGLFTGISDTSFGPDIAMTRGMFVTVLGRLANVDVDSYTESTFKDVKSDAYYMGYIEWASKNKIVKGIGNGNFAPDQPITREQVAVIISNYAKTMDLKLTQTHGENTFADSSIISAYAKDAVDQMQMLGILSGKMGNIFDPQGIATRAELSAVLHRFVELASSNDTM